MVQASWAAVVGAGKSTVKAVALLHRMGPSYRATARLESGFYDRVASLANDAKEFTTTVAAPGRKAKIAWGRALQKVPPGCLARLEGTEGKDSDLIHLLTYDGKSKEAKIAIWFEKIEAVLADFPLLQRAVEKMGTASAARDAIQAMANSLLIDKASFPSLPSFAAMEKILADNDAVLKDAKLGEAGLADQVELLSSKRSASGTLLSGSENSRGGAAGNPRTKEQHDAYLKTAPFYEGVGELTKICTEEPAEHGRTYDLIVKAIELRQLPLQHHVLGHKNHHALHKDLLEVWQEGLGKLVKDNLAPFSRLVVNTVLMNSACQIMMSESSDEEEDDEDEDKEKWGHKRFHEHVIDPSFLEKLIRGQDYETLDWEYELVHRVQAKLKGQPTPDKSKMPAPFSDAQTLRLLVKPICILFSDVIGFEDVSPLKKVLRYAANALDRASGHEFFNKDIQQRVPPFVKEALRVTGQRRKTYWDSPVYQTALTKQATSFKSDAFNSLQSTVSLLNKSINERESLPVFHLIQDRKRKDHEGGSDDQEGNSSPPSPLDTLA